MNEIQQTALQRLGIEALTPMQEAMLACTGDPGDILLLSPTGSGKTVAYLLPLIQRFGALTANPSPLTVSPAALVVVPSRELAQQIESVWKQMGTPWKALSVYGGRPAMDEHRTLREVRPALIVGTPGRLNDHLQKGNIDASAVHTLVLDEYDKCLELGFQDEMQTLIDRLPHVERRWYVSATEVVPPSSSDEGAGESPKSVSLAEGRRFLRLDYRGAQARISTYLVHSPEKDKLQTLYRLLCALDGAQTIVFAGFRESVERIGTFLREQRLVHAVYHGGLEQDLRERALYKFRNGSVNVLVSTDLASRGLDIPEVQHIVHYHRPVNEEASIHRTGRTARWDASGNSYYILAPAEQAPEWLTKTAATSEPLADFPLPDITRRPTPPAWETLYIGKGKKDKLNRIDIAGFLYKKGNLTSDDVGRIDVLDHYAYAAVRRTKVRQLLALVSGEKIKGMKTIIEVAH